MAKIDYPYVKTVKREVNGVEVPYIRIRDPLTKKRSLRSLKSLGYKSFAAAESYIADLSRQMQEKAQLLKHEAEPELMRQREAASKRHLSISALIPPYIKAIGAEKDRKAAKNRASNLKRLTKWLENDGRRFNTCASFSKKGIREFRTWLIDQPKMTSSKEGIEETQDGLAPDTLNTIRTDCIAFFNWLTQEEYTSLERAHITASFKTYRTKKRLPKYLTSEELKLILNAACSIDLETFTASREDKAAYSQGRKSETAKRRFEPMAPLILMAMLSGCRLGECLHLRWAGVDWKRKTIRIQADKASGWEVKTKFERDIPFGESPALERLLLRLKAQKGASPYIIKGADESKPKNWRLPSFKRITKAAGLPELNFKAFRSTFASALTLWQRDGRGLPIRACADRLGHSIKVAEEHYYEGAQPIDAENIEAMLGVEQEINRAIDRLFPLSGAESIAASA